MGLLDDSNFKISLTSLQIISDLLDRFAEQARASPDLRTSPRDLDRLAEHAAAPTPSRPLPPSPISSPRTPHTVRPPLLTLTPLPPTAPRGRGGARRAPSSPPRPRPVGPRR